MQNEIFSFSGMIKYNSTSYCNSIMTTEIHFIYPSMEYKNVINSSECQQAHNTHIYNH